MNTEFEILRTTFADREKARRDSILSAKATYRQLVLRRLSEPGDGRWMTDALDTLAAHDPGEMVYISSPEQIDKVREVHKTVPPLTPDTIAADYAVLDRIDRIEKEIEKLRPAAKQLADAANEAKRVWETSPASLGVEEKDFRHRLYREAIVANDANSAPATRIERLKQDIAAVKMEAGSRRMFDQEWLTELHTR